MTVKLETPHKVLALKFCLHFVNATSVLLSLFSYLARSDLQIRFQSKEQPVYLQPLRTACVVYDKRSLPEPSCNLYCEWPLLPLLRVRAAPLQPHPLLEVQRHFLRDSLVSLACLLPPRNMRTMCGTDRRVAKKEKHSEHSSKKQTNLGHRFFCQKTRYFPLNIYWSSHLDY